MKGRDRRWWREHLIAVSFVVVSLLGVPLTYLSGKSLARLENKVLQGYGFRVSPEEVQPFSRLKVSGSGLMVRVGCGEEVDVKVADHPDDLYIIQRRPERLLITGQQLTSSEPFLVNIANSAKLLHLEVRNGARVDVEACAVSDTQVTIDIAAGSELAMSGETVDLYLFASTGSRLLPGPQGPLVFEKAVVDMVFGTSADLCGATYGVRGSASLGSVIKVREHTTVLELNPAVISHNCAATGSEVTT